MGRFFAQNQIQQSIILMIIFSQTHIFDRFFFLF